MGSGLNVRSADADLLDSEASDLWNVVFTDSGRPVKRTGTTQVNTANLPSSPLGLYWWRPVPSKSLLFAVCVSANVGVLIQIDTSNGSQTQVGSGLSTTAQPWMVTFSGKLLIADGTGAPWFYDYVNNKFGRLGVAAPTAAPTVALGAAGNLNATNVQYVVTFERYDGSESLAGPESAVIAPTNQQVNLSAIPTSADSLVMKRNIYRIGGSLTTFYLVDTISNNTTTTWTDNVADSTALQGRILSLRNAVPPTLTGLAVYRERLWGIGDPNNPSTLYWTELDLPNAWGDGTNNIELDPDYGGSLVGLAPAGARLIVAKPLSVYYFFGDPPNNYTSDRIRAPEGTWNGQSMAYANGLLTYLGSSSFYVTDGLTGDLLPDDSDQRRWNKLEPLITAVDRTKVVSATYWQRYYFCAVTSGSTQQVFVFDYRSKAWSRFDWAVNAWASDDQGNLYAAHSTQPVVMKCLVSGTYSDLGVGIHYRWVSKSFDFGNDVWQKRIGSTWVQGDLSPATINMTLSADQGSFQQTISLSLGNSNTLQWDGAGGTTWDNYLWADSQTARPRQDWPKDMRGRLFRFTFDETSTNSVAPTEIAARWREIRVN